MIGANNDDLCPGARHETQRLHPVEGAVKDAQRARGTEQLVSVVPGPDHRRRCRRPEFGDRRRRAVGRPALSEHDVAQRLASRPSGPLEARPGRPFVRPADAEPPQRLDSFGQVEQGRQLIGTKERDPPHTESLGACGQPQVFNGAGAGPDVGIDKVDRPRTPLAGTRRSQHTMSPTGASRIPSSCRSSNCWAASGSMAAAWRLRSRSAISAACSRVDSSRTTMNRQGWECPTEGAAWAAWRIRSNVVASIGSGRNRLMSRRPSSTA